MTSRRAEIDRLRLEDPIIAAALAHADAAGLSYQDALELAVVTYSREMRILRAKLLALVSGLPNQDPIGRLRIPDQEAADELTRGLRQRRASAFPPCAFCGARYEAHEEVGIAGERGHRINMPHMPQHGEYHPFTPLPPGS